VAPVCDERGQVRRIVSISRETTERKRAEEARQLLLGELNHRVKNLFAIASGMVAMTARRAKSTVEMAEALTGRLMALARSHELIRPAITGTVHGAGTATLHELVMAVVAPHLSSDTDQLRIQGPDLQVGPGAATSLALVLHELATNAAKYGALSASEGCLEVEWRIADGVLMLAWTERGGPSIEKPPEHKGFGSQLARTSASGQLGGRIAYDWTPAGVRITLTINLRALQR
jgi:two-component sensor histidine kinase